MRKFLAAAIVLLLVGIVGMTAFAVSPANTQFRTSAEPEQNYVSSIDEESCAVCHRRNCEEHHTNSEHQPHCNARRRGCHSGYHGGHHCR